MKKGCKILLLNLKSASGLLALFRLNGRLIPRLQKFDCLVIRQIASHRRNGNIAFIHRFKIRAAFGVKTGSLFANPIIQFAARVNVFADNRTRIFETLFGNTDAFNFAFRVIDVQQSFRRQTFFDSFLTIVLVICAASVKS